VFFAILRYTDCVIYIPLPPKCGFFGSKKPTIGAFSYFSSIFQGCQVGIDNILSIFLPLFLPKIPKKINGKLP
jgi:hypothetical protein